MYVCLYMCKDPSKYQLLSKGHQSWYKSSYSKRKLYILTLFKFTKAKFTLESMKNVKRQQINK